MQIVVEIVLQKFRYGDRHRYVRSPDVGLQEHRTSRYRGGTDRLHQGWPLSGIQNRLAKTRFRSLKQLKFQSRQADSFQGITTNLLVRSGLVKLCVGRTNRTSWREPKRSA